MTFGMFILLMIFAHYIGDYVLKSEYLSVTKGKKWYNMLVHCILYTGSVGWVLVKWTGGLPFFGLLWLFVSHWIIDSWKCRGLKKEPSTERDKKMYLYLDQAYHFIILACLVIWYGWFGTGTL